MIELLNQFCKRGMFSLILTLSINETILKFGCSIKSFTEKKKGMKTKVKVLFAVKTKRITLNELRTSGGHWNNVVSPLRSVTTMKCSCLEEISHF